MVEPLEVLMLRRSVHRTNADGVALVNAEELLTQIFIKVMGTERVKLTESVCDEALLEESDEVLSQFPILVYKHWMIPRKYIWQFWREVASIDSHLSEEQAQLLHLISELICDRLGPLTKMNETDEQAEQQKSWLRRIISNLFEPSAVEVQAFKTEFLALNSSAHSFNETQLIFKRINLLLADQKCLFGDNVTSLDLLAYAHLKTVLVNSSQSKEKELLEQTYPKLMAFVERIESNNSEGGYEIVPLNGWQGLSDPQKWLDTHFKQIQRPRTSDRIVTVQLDPQISNKRIDDLERVQRLHHSFNQRNRMIHLGVFASVTAIVTLISIKH